jgi:hypothetical protein
LTLIGNSTGPGLGTAGRGTCGMIEIHNGSVSASGATGISSGVNGSSTEAIRILGGNISTQRSDGAGIGSGAGYSHVTRIEILNGTVNASGWGGAGMVVIVGGIVRRMGLVMQALVLGAGLERRHWSIMSLFEVAKWNFARPHSGDRRWHPRGYREVRRGNRSRNWVRHSQ